MRWSLVSACFCLIAAFGVSAEKDRFDGYQVLRVNATSKEQLDALEKLREDETDVDFWTDPSMVVPTDIMVKPQHTKSFEGFLSRMNIPFDIMIPDVQSLIDEENEIDPFRPMKPVDWKDYNTLEEIHAWMDKVASNNRNVKVTEAGKSTEGRSLKIMTFGTGTKKIWIDAGIHAREWITPATTTYIINELLKPENAELLKLYQWHFLPVNNPDGYVYTFTNNRMWRKTRKVPEGGGCVGVDANRNWDYNWNKGGSSGSKCSQVYHGPKAFSEPETREVAKFMTKNGPYHIAISIHSYSQMWMNPWGYTKQHSSDHDELVRAAKKSMAALKAVNGLDFVVGSVYEVIYPASGISIDWMKGVAKAKYVYTPELRDKGRYGFVLPKEQIIPSGKEVWAAVKTLAYDVKDKSSE